MSYRRRDRVQPTADAPTATPPVAGAPAPHPSLGSTASESSHQGAGGRSADVLAYVDVLHALRELDRVDCAALRLVYWGGRTQAQVAAKLDLPLRTVRTAVASGLRLVADYLLAP